MGDDEKSSKTPKRIEPARAVDYRGHVPDWVIEAINTQLAIDSEDARRAGTVGYMARALVQATLPYRDPKVDVFTRRNGTFTLRISAGYEGGIPYGIYPRLLTSWVATEAVRTQSPEIELGDSLSSFLREVLELGSRGGGKRGSASRVSEQMKRLFGAAISAQDTRRGFEVRNITLVDYASVSDATFQRIDQAVGYRAIKSDAPTVDKDDAPMLWTPQAIEHAGQWRSRLVLTHAFFSECTTSPVPIDLRAYKALRGSALAMDIYAWLTYRMSYLRQQSLPIPWEALMFQFGTGFKADRGPQAVRDFRRDFLRALKTVLLVYPTAQVSYTSSGLVLQPSAPHVPMTQQFLKLD